MMMVVQYILNGTIHVYKKKIKMIGRLRDEKITH